MYELMERAGKAAFDFMLEHNLVTRKVVVIAGTGNNGGDGYVLARLMTEHGHEVVMASIQPNKALVGDAKTAREKWIAAGHRVVDAAAINFDDFDVIVDGLLGTGLSGKVSSTYASLIARINQAGCYVLSLDIPSGTHADSGQTLGCSIKADATITFVGIKTGLVTSAGKYHTGKLILSTLGIEAEYVDVASASATLLGFDDFKRLESRSLHSHKGHFGRLLCVGGNQGMSGAIRLSAEAAMRTGAGLVKVFCHSKSVMQVSSGRPELMVTDDNLAKHLKWADCIVFGPGLGQDAWSQGIFNQVLSYLVHEDKPVVIDADGLNLLSQHLHKLTLSNMVVTPHPAEAARLLHATVEEIENNRFNSADSIHKRFNSACVLKGAGSLVHNCEALFVCADGNPGMATAGMGDILTGIIGSLLSQGMSKQQASIYGTCLHAKAADLQAAERGQRGMLASDIFEHLPNLVN